ncbi:hypothetical protein CANARDRAFT_176952 [[Candida] arabinofermentans NRRL YB-2248]|uniref:Uncharacterized protein n=1 Tax=[Candida] arabinofermentans NRRL YB-2248 TaxID=983967 RepID=A0A1E4SY24_9ASCO|nr:hypothetical protein CANARDRAFT_176952 [[Candida] arabinofermentans NRRL YB-2248]
METSVENMLVALHLTIFLFAQAVLLRVETVESLLQNNTPKAVTTLRRKGKLTAFLNHVKYVFSPRVKSLEPSSSCKSS